MTSEKLREHLLQIADGIKTDTRLEDIYEQLALLEDIEESEEEEKKGQTIPHEDVIKRSAEWLK
jgi:hypothetical protein